MIVSDITSIGNKGHNKLIIKKIKLMYTTFIVFGAGIVFGYVFKKRTLILVNSIELLLNFLSYFLIFITVIKLGQQNINIYTYFNWVSLSIIFCIASMVTSIGVTKILLHFFPDNS